MAVKKHTYINTDKDGFIEENRSPLSPPWMLSGLQNIGKVLVGGKDGFVEWGEGGSGGGSGTTNYELLENKPKINGVELIGNVAINYFKNADITPDGKTLVLTKENGEAFNFTPHENETYVKNATINGSNLILTCVENNVESTKSFGLTTSTINNLISQYLNQNFFDALKLYLGSGFVIDNNNKKISVNERPEPPRPTSYTGIFSKDTYENRYRYYDYSTIFNPTDDIRYILLDQNSREPQQPISYTHSIPRTQFNEELFIIDYQGNFNGNNSHSFLANCQSFNSPIDLSHCNWTVIGKYFMLNCATFNSPIIFPYTIQEIRSDFMNGCGMFNKNLTNLFGGNLRIIEHNFMNECHNFAQDIGLDKSTCPNIQDIELDNFMYNCKNFTKIFHMTNQSFDIFSIYDVNAFDFLRCFATNDATAASFVSGFHIAATDKTKQDFTNFAIEANGTTYYPFADKTSDTPLKKLVINGSN